MLSPRPLIGSDGEQTEERTSPRVSVDRQRSRQLRNDRRIRNVLLVNSCQLVARSIIGASVLCPQGHEHQSPTPIRVSCSFARCQNTSRRRIHIGNQLNDDTIKIMMINMVIFQRFRGSLKAIFPWKECGNLNTS
jgi:hypothetical protein